MAFPNLTAPTATPARRAEDDHTMPTHLAPGEFRPRGIVAGTHAISLGSSSHEHPVDPERLTITCVICQKAEEAVLARVDLRHLTLEIPAETYLDLKAAAGGRPVEIYAAELLSRPEKR
ncbi:MAG TPA: hypothetical protein VNH20_07025 [Candidatus Dormibacteraeota bacterium]|nr:hypothetical protein [Candidatus Dormibacteraeota bacterium]